MSDVAIGPGKVVVNRAMSLDGFIAGPGHAMDWIAEHLSADAFPEVMAATGAMLIGRGTYEVAKGMAGQDTAYDGEHSSSSLTSLPTSRTPRSHSSPVDLRKPLPRHAAPRAARTWRSLVPTWPPSACNAGSSTRSWCMSYRCYWATASASRPQASTGSTWNLSATPSRAP